MSKLKDFAESIDSATTTKKRAKKESFLLKIDPDIADKVRADAYWSGEKISHHVETILQEYLSGKEIKPRPKEVIQLSKPKGRTPKF